MNKLYRQVKLTDEEHDDFVFPHIMGMTGEKLHSKAEIAEELGVRDKRIAELEKAINVIDSACITWGFTFDVTNPKQSLNKLLRIETESARDPQICREAEVFALEQQAKGVEDYAEQENKLKELYHFKDGEDIQHINLITGLNSRAKHLRKKAAKLKEQEQ